MKTGLPLIIDRHSPLPTYEQIRLQIADLIQAGQLTAGHRLPSIRSLANDLQVAPGTVARAYAKLETEELIESNCATGSHVLPQQKVGAELRLAAERFVQIARLRGVDQSDALSLVRTAWKRASTGTKAETLSDTNIMR